MYAGKSTIGEVLSQELGIPHISVDEIAESHYLKNGLDPHTLQQICDSEDFREYVDFMRPYEIQAVKEIVREYSDAVISFGAGHSYAETDEDQAQFLEIKDLSPNIFLILPSQDAETSRKVLEERMEADEPLTSQKLESKKEVNSIFLKSESNSLLANHVIYTEGRTPEESAREIINQLT